MKMPEKWTSDFNDSSKEITQYEQKREKIENNEQSLGDL